jgi:hypothetical protein
MSLATPARNAIRALLAQSAYTGEPPRGWLSLDAPLVERVRSLQGGHLALRPEIQVEWLLQQRTEAIESAVAGDLSPASLLWKSICTDGTFMGVLGVYSAGITALPRKWRGDPGLVSQLMLGSDSVRSVYDNMVPPDQSELMLQDGKGMGVAVGEIVPVPGRYYGVLRRLPPEGLRYRWSSNMGSWFYQTTSGLLPITPGDGRWVLWEPGGTDAAPWERGAWIYASRAYINKEHAILEQANFCRTLANPAILTTTPQGASESDRSAWFGAFANWGMNMVASAPVPGYDAKVLEIQGQGFRAFKDMIDAANQELIISIWGTNVPVTGGAAFASTDLFASPKDVLTKRAARSWDHLVNTQIIPAWTIATAGLDALEGSPCIETDATPPKDSTAIAQSWIQMASSVREVYEVSKLAGVQPKAESVRDMLFRQTGLEFEELPKGTKPAVKLQLAPTDLAKVVRVDEARISQDLDPIGDDRGDKMLTELENEKPAGEVPATAEVAA